jgi:Rrf2 family protein
MLSKKTKYGLKALVFLAKQFGEGPVPIARISESENISQKFLESILLDMRKYGLLGSKKGKSGGYYLLKAADEIRMTEVIRILEGPIAMVPCVSLNFYEPCSDCKDEENCSIRLLMIQVRDKALEVYRNSTLQDLLSPEQKTVE